MKKPHQRLCEQAQAEDERLQSEIERTQQLFDVTVKSLEELSLVTDYEGYKYEKLADPAIGEKVSPMALKVLPVSAILGMLAGFGLAYLVDISDKAFRTPDEVSQVMRLPVVGHIPLIDTESQQLLRRIKGFTGRCHRSSTEVTAGRIISSRENFVVLQQPRSKASSYSSYQSDAGRW